MSVSTTTRGRATQGSTWEAGGGRAGDVGEHYQAWPLQVGIHLGGGRRAGSQRRSFAPQATHHEHRSHGVAHPHLPQAEGGIVVLQRLRPAKALAAAIVAGGPTSSAWMSSPLREPGHRSTTAPIAESGMTTRFMTKKA